MDLRLLDELAAEELRFKKFSFVGTSRVLVSGNLRTGFAVNVRPSGVVAVSDTPVGACCIGEGCSIQTEAACISLGGTYEGDGVPCSEGLCAPIGRCCLPDGSCDDLTESDCTDAGGDWTADENCDDNPCPTPCCDGAFVNPLGDGRCFLSYDYAIHVVISHPGFACGDTYCDQTATINLDPVTCERTCIGSGWDITHQIPGICGDFHGANCDTNGCIGDYVGCSWLPGYSVSGDTLTFEYFCPDGCDSSESGCEHGIVTWTYYDECICV